ncbi:hypothetical protein EVAR_6673_1 [Eumeta japonica]|uniref:Uncharacterized protein n=1 Tax=Eumeta variegata TaxID=151549 RepID=A0A4C1TNC9_EUMVA|nr:hypothetical protein EVAR_6673_1 [Eumeta japonica]
MSRLTESDISRALLDETIEFESENENFEEESENDSDHLSIQSDTSSEFEAEFPSSSRIVLTIYRFRTCAKIELHIIQVKMELLNGRKIHTEAMLVVELKILSLIYPV